MHGVVSFCTSIGHIAAALVPNRKLDAPDYLDRTGPSRIRVAGVLNHTMGFQITGNQGHVKGCTLNVYIWLTTTHKQYRNPKRLEAKLLQTWSLEKRILTSVILWPGKLPNWKGTLSRHVGTQTDLCEDVSFSSVWGHLFKGISKAKYISHKCPQKIDDVLSEAVGRKLI